MAVSLIRPPIPTRIPGYTANPLPVGGGYGGNQAYGYAPTPPTLPKSPLGTMSGYTGWNRLPTGGGYPAGATPWGAAPLPPAPPHYGGNPVYGPGAPGGPGPAQPGYGINVGGQNWANLIGGDYGVQEMESLMNSQMGRAQGDFQTQLRQNLIDLGVTDPKQLGTFGKYIDANTIQQAAANKYSQMARVQQMETANQNQMQASLAARGLLGSGQLAKSTEDILAQGESGRYDALRQFLQGGAQGLTQLADMNNQYAMQLAQARADAAARAAQTYWAMGAGGGYSPYGPGYDQFGNPINPNPTLPPLPAPIYGPGYGVRGAISQVPGIGI